VDEAATDALRDAARNDTKTVYKLDQTLVDQYTGEAEQFFNDIDAFRLEAEQLRAARIAGSGLKADGSLSVEDWQKILTEQELQQMTARFTVGLSVRRAGGCCMWRRASCSVCRILYCPS
jgi:membrane-associated HD superfamily phosphohydrolase